MTCHHPQENQRIVLLKKNHKTYHNCNCSFFFKN